MNPNIVSITLLLSLSVGICQPLNGEDTEAYKLTAKQITREYIDERDEQKMSVSDFLHDKNINDKTIADLVHKYAAVAEILEQDNISTQSPHYPSLLEYGYELGSQLATQPNKLYNKIAYELLKKYGNSIPKTEKFEIDKFVTHLEQDKIQKGPFFETLIKYAKEAIELENLTSRNDGAFWPLLANTSKVRTNKKTIQSSLKSQQKEGVLKFFQFGYRKLSPYSFVKDETTEPPMTTLEEGDDASTLFLEFLYSNRWAWNRERTLFSEKNGDDSYLVFEDLFDSDPDNNDKWGIGKIDFEFRFAYNFNNNTEKTASAIAGSSEIDLEISLARNLYRYRFDDNSAFALSVEYSSGVSTDKSSFDSHEKEFLGVSFTASFSTKENPNRFGRIIGRIGKIEVDTVSYLNHSSRALDTIRGDLIKYSSKKGTAFETELIYPIGESAYVSLAGKVYSGIDPDTWSIQVAYSQPITELINGLLSKKK